jgi:heme/copper-type cytochrome/quinol oxidase subunit 2
MRAHYAVALVAIAAAVVAAPASARPALKYQVDVTVTDSGCTIDHPSVSHRNTTILFHVVNAGDVPHGFSIRGVRSGMLQAHQEGRFYVNFGKPGHWTFQCVSGRYPHPHVLKHGTFTIRKS